MGGGSLTYLQKSYPCILQYDLCRRLRLQFLVLLMMGAVGTRNMYSDFAVNKYLHTVASGWIFINIELLCTEP
jgi:hypothetical protein